MAGFNPNVPTVLGSEFLPSRSSLLRLDSGVYGVATRFRSPGTPTISHLHVPVESVVGNPGLALEIVSTLTPTISYTDYYPGTDTGATVTGWTDQSAGAANYSEVDDRADTDYHQNTAALAQGRALNNDHRGNDSGALSGKRVLRLDVGALIHLRTGVSGNGTTVPVMGRVTIDGTAYTSPAVNRSATATPTVVETLGSWERNPSTGLPWTVAEADDIIDAADADTFGVRVGGKLAAGGFRLAGKWLRIWYCTENRVGYYYAGGKPTAGWVEYTLSGTSALTANTSYYVIVSALLGSPTDNLTVRRVEDPDVLLDSSASGTGEHRTSYDLRLFSRGGAAASSTERTGMLPFLLDASTTIQTPSQPYQTVAELTVHRSGTANQGQQLTTDGSTTTYAGVWVVVGWENPLVRPDQPLGIAVRHGGGAISGGGSLDATAILLAEDSVPGPTRVLVPFASSFTASATTQYHALFSSDATSGWKIYRADTVSGTIGSGTTVNEIEGATQGGQTDSYVAAGSASDRYDVALAMISTPTAPAGLTATVTAGDSETPPDVTLTWTATSRTSTFFAYRIYRRPSRAAARAWSLIGENAVPDGYTAATVEARHTAFRDRAAWAAGPYEDGWDYAVTVVDSATNLESAPSASTVTRVTVDDPGCSWLVCNEAPWLDTPLDRVNRLESTTIDDIDVYRPAGRDFAVTRRRAEDPPRQWALSWRKLGAHGDEAASIVRTAATADRQVTILTPRGDRIEGSLSAPKTSQQPAPFLDVDATIIETSRDPGVAGFNLPAGAILDGAADYFTMVAASDLDVTTSPFTLIVAAAFADAGTAASKGNLGTSDGYGIRRNAAGTLQFLVDGASASGGPAYASADWFDGAVHVAAGSSSGTAQTLYMDGAAVATASVTHGTITNASQLAVGANNSGASGKMAAAPLQSWALYRRVLTADEHQDAADYLLGVPGATMPAGATLFIDLRDLRCWDGVATYAYDLTGNGHIATAVSAPPTRGVPWPLGDLERWT